MLTLKQRLAKNYINARGWRTKRKLLLIESDDWGAIRMPSRKVYEDLLSEEIEVHKHYFDRNDSLESSEDLSKLFDVLDSFRDINNNPAILTAFMVVANPNFDKIEASGRKEYSYELITESYKRQSHTANTFDLLLEGAQKKLLYPQFHGREHLHPFRWIKAINSKSEKENLAFKQEAFISSTKVDDPYNYPIGYMAAFNWSERSEVAYQKKVISDGLRLFNEIFGFKSVSFVAPQTIWSNEINSTLIENGVKLTIGQQLRPIGDNKTKLINNIWGFNEKSRLTHWRRNCTFEPSRDQDYDWISRTMSEIAIAFRWGKPAVINSHRVNYIGSIFPENRDQSLQKLKRLLTEVTKKWPEVEFINTEDLAKIMLKNKDK